MTKEMNTKPNYAEELLEILHSSLSDEELLDRIRSLVQNDWQRSLLRLMIRMHT